MGQMKRVDSTLESLINTNQEVRNLSHQLLRSPHPGAALKGPEIQMLINSPFGNLIKNTLFAVLIYNFILHKVRVHDLEQRLAALGMKEAMYRHYEHIRHLEEDDYLTYIRTVEQEYTSENVAHPSIVPRLVLELTTYEAELEAELLALASIRTAQNMIKAQQLAEEDTQITAILDLSQRFDLIFTKAQAAALIHHRAHTPEGQIRALGLFSTDGETVNNVERMQQFVTMNAFSTTMLRFEQRLDQLHNDFAKKNDALIQGKLRCLELEHKIEKTQRALNHLEILPAKPKAEIPQETLEQLARQQAAQKPSKS
ncbi:MAG: hypothetical protein M3R00_03475 [Pseudomonadota bacterium]|nr:hypothetical protein [Pseudomonadota bacterium]